ncbi:DUF1326 domain-containing protein [Sneathiella chungangensis]|uniref:DUF1326 domain-containing protein n=1 Tax=Sneathiella chungangensis TaxID=1418234 RepID=A0A845MN86_9PROT|nr:DUF1326 domain-containing protein [Sneathiella chungangensis]MZR23924.1 DUF1326 domain-containing protein [Sneathiella chungangensis]
MTNVKDWWMKGDWFDSCSCDIPCPCEFAQAPSDNRCEGFVAYNIKEGAYGGIRIDGLSVLIPGIFYGNLWAGECKMSVTMLVDERATSEQREALGVIFSEDAGGFMSHIFSTIAEIVAVEYVPITFEIADDLTWWKAESPGRAKAHVEALGGPTTRPGTLVQTTNPPGSEVGADALATWGKSKVSQVSTQGFNWDWEGQSSKHMPFDLKGPAPAEVWFEEA